MTAPWWNVTDGWLQRAIVIQAERRDYREIGGSGWQKQVKGSGRFGRRPFLRGSRRSAFVRQMPVRLRLSPAARPARMRYARAACSRSEVQMPRPSPLSCRL